MIPAKAGTVGRQLEVLWTSGTSSGLSDAQLLGRFTGGGEGAAEPAFRELVDRHGPMVLGVCRQILRRPQDADDAFQATFLVLVRKARSIRVHDSLAPWLYGVAYRTAHRARAAASRYRTAGVEPMAAVADPTPDGPFELDVRPLLHEELARLPGKYREPIVLCHLEGKSHEEAARLLSCPVGTVSGRLSRGRQLLRTRLERRGVGVSPMMLASPWLSGTLSAPAASLVESTLAAAARFAAAGTIPASVQSLTQGVLRTMLLNKLKAVSLSLVLVGAATGGIAWTMRSSGAASPSGPPQAVGGQAAPPQAREKAGRPLVDPNADAPPAQGASNNLPVGPQAQGQVITSPNNLGAGPSGAGGMLLPGTGVGAANLPKNSPNLAGPFDPVPFFRSADIIVVESPDRTTIQAMSLELVDHGGEFAAWDKFTLPQGVTASALMSGDTVALHFRGKTIDRVAAFSRRTGHWKDQRLLKPAEDELSPLITPGGAVYQVGNDVYAYSSRQGTWGVLHLEGGEKPRVILYQNDISAMQGNRLYVFSLNHGNWSPGVEVNLERFRRKPQGAAHGGSEGSRNRP